MKRSGFFLVVRLLVLAVCAGPFSYGMIFYSTADPDFNTTPPSGALANSGWQFVGAWTGYQGVAIGPHHFLAARHVGGAVGDAFVLNGVSYVTSAFFDDAPSDLRICEIAGSFPAWAPLYRQANETGKDLVVFGRGLTRGGEVRVNGVLKGWFWGTTDGRLRWGTNRVSSVVNGGPPWGELLSATFDAAGESNEAHLALGDSSGPVFIHDGTAWALAGVAATVDGSFNTTNTGDGFIAALFDVRGLYYSATPPTGWALVTGPVAVPTAFYATRVSTRAAWIDSIVGPTLAEPTDAPLLGGIGRGILVATLLSAGIFGLQRRRLTSERVAC